ncbi:MAG: S8 family serine peptidase, partial [Caldilineaceae bacterium]
VGEPIANLLGSEQTLTRYQITDSTPITAVIQQSSSGCRRLPNYLLTMSGTNSVFGSPFDNPNNQEPDPTKITQARMQLHQQNSPFTGAGVTVVVFDSYCPATATALASDQFLQKMGLTDLVVKPAFIVSIPVTATPPLAPQCSHNEAVISLAKTIAPAAKIELWPVLDEQGLGALSGLLAALQAFHQSMTAQQRYVINLSLGVAGDIAPGDMAALASLLQRLNGPGRVLVAAAGNWRALPNPPVPPDGAQAPAAWQTIALAVHATDSAGLRTGYSNLGAIGAPGGLHSCTTDSLGQPTAACLTFYNSRSTTGASGWKGSSYATALTSGVVALLLEQDGLRDLTEVRRLLWCGARGPDGLIDVEYTLFHCRNRADLGDAPDGVNTAGVPMTSYPSAILAAFPTIYGEANAPLGPIHWRPNADIWLGRLVSGEREADQLPDSDGVSNLDLRTNLADRDGADDGLILATLSLPECALTRFQYGVTVAVKGTVRYVNGWFDYNRDGDWNDSVLCTEAGKRYRVSEWAVRNQAIPVTLGVGYRLRTTPYFRTVNAPTPTNPLWLRITVSEQKAPLIPGKTLADGRGPTQGYRFGETEDYLLTGVLLPAQSATMAAPADWPTSAAAGEDEPLLFDGSNDELLEETVDRPAQGHRYYLPLLNR